MYFGAEYSRKNIMQASGEGRAHPHKYVPDCIFP
jgi:hypothetical protein